LDQGRSLVAAGYLALLAVIFIAMANLFLPMAQGRGADRSAPGGRHEALWATLPPATLGSLVLVLGVYVPPAMSTVLHEVARSLGGH
jgi:hypothetical protein